MKQLGHASQLIPLIHPQDDDEQIMSDDDLSQLLSRQLNHSDGIRGFFATYLTSPESLTTEDVPKVHFLLHITHLLWRTSIVFAYEST